MANTFIIRNQLAVKKTEQVKLRKRRQRSIVITLIIMCLVKLLLIIPFISFTYCSINTTITISLLAFPYIFRKSQMIVRIQGDPEVITLSFFINICRFVWWALFHLINICRFVWWAVDCTVWQYSPSTSESTTTIHSSPCMLLSMLLFSCLQEWSPFL